MLRQPETPATPMIPIISIGVNGLDRVLLSKLAWQNRWEVHFAETPADAQIALQYCKAVIVFCDRELPGAVWREAVRQMASSGNKPCVILLSPVSDDYLWKEVTDHGGYDVLHKPLKEDEVVRSVRLAASYWKANGGTSGDSRVATK